MEKGRDILREYGGDSNAPEKPRAKSGGVTKAKDLDYCEPQGPTAQHQEGPGLHGESHSAGSQGRH